MDHISPGTNGSNDELSGQVVPFGKYKGRSVAELASDDSYREWVLAQPWVRMQYANFYQILVHGGPPPQHSPEHNEMQARFLDGNWCLSLARLLPGLGDHGLREAVDQITAWRKRNLAANPQIAETVSIEQPEVSDVQMENQGWDVTFRYRPSMLVQAWACECDVRPDLEWQSKIKDGFTSARQQWLNEDYKPREPVEPYIYGKPAKPTEPGRSPHTIAGYLQETPSWYERDLAAYNKALAEYPGKLAEYSKQVAAAQAAYREELAGYPEKLAAYQDQRHYALDHCRNQNTFRTQTRWRHQPLIAAELKPDLGDDYPNVLRQVQKYMTVRRSYGRGHYGDEPTCDAAFVVARRAQFTSVTWDQVRQIFSKSGILLVSESSLGNGQPL